MKFKRGYYYVSQEAETRSVLLPDAISAYVSIAGGVLVVADRYA